MAAKHPPNLPLRTNKKALITGASSGIGKDLATQFAAHGHDVVLVARRVEALAQLATELSTQYGIDVRVVAKDLATPHAAKELWTELNDVEIEFLVNNAGVGTYGDLLATAPELLSSMLQLNIMALTELTRLFAAPMKTRRSGAVLNVASTAAFQPGPHMAGYYASKAFVLSLSEALAFELAPHGVTVTALCPGPTASNFQQNAGMETSRMVKQRHFMMTSEAVARVGYAGMVAGKVVVIPGTANKVVAKTVPLFPRRLVTRLSAFMAGSPLTINTGS
jgi:short-subunit dehydrogenase